jgi:Carboxypeptidase regulatory-like domain
MTATIPAAVFALFSAILAVPVWANDLPSPEATGHIEGQIVLYPATPVARAGDPNRRGIAGQVAVIDAASAVVANVASDAKGRFQFDLPPGHYTLRLTSQRWPGSSKPEPVTVERGRVTNAVLTYDAGIR